MAVTVKPLIFKSHLIRNHLELWKLTTTPSPRKHALPRRQLTHLLHPLPLPLPTHLHLPLHSPPIRHLNLTPCPSLPLLLRFRPSPPMSSLTSSSSSSSSDSSHIKTVINNSLSFSFSPICNASSYFIQQFGISRSNICVVVQVWVMKFLSGRFALELGLGLMILNCMGKLESGSFDLFNTIHVCKIYI